MVIYASGQGSQYANNTLPSMLASIPASGSGSQYAYNNLLPQNQGDVLGADTTRTTNTQPQTTQMTSQQAMEQVPAQPEINWDEIYQPAFDAIAQAEQAQQSSYQAGLGEAQSGYQQRTADLANEQATRLADYGSQRSTETKKTEGAVAEARRMASQLLQGLQSQFGGSTGTGQFRGELLGSQASSNIANNRAALQTALTGIANSENALKDKVIALQNAEDQTLANAKLKLRASLDKALADIASTKGQLAADKGARRADALSAYRDQLAQVEARNAQFRQTLYQQAQEQARKLGTLKQSAQDKWAATVKMFEPYGITPGKAFSYGGQSGMLIPTSSGEGRILTGSISSNNSGVETPEEFAQ